MAQAKYEQLGNMTALMSEAVDYPNMKYNDSVTIVGGEYKGYSVINVWEKDNHAEYITITKKHSGPKVEFPAKQKVNYANAFAIADHKNMAYKAKAEACQFEGGTGNGKYKMNYAGADASADHKNMEYKANAGAFNLEFDNGIAKTKVGCAKAGAAFQGDKLQPKSVKEFFEAKFASANANASLVDQEADHPLLGKVKNKLGTANANAEASLTYVGVDASANVLETNVGCFSSTVGVGVSTGAGIKDGSASVKVAGCGVTIGRKVGVSFLSTSVGIDFGYFF